MQVLFSICNLINQAISLEKNWSIELPTHENFEGIDLEGIKFTYTLDKKGWNYTLTLYKITKEGSIKIHLSFVQRFLNIPLETTAMIDLLNKKTTEFKVSAT